MSHDNPNEIAGGPSITGTVQLIQSKFTWHVKSLTEAEKSKYGLKSPSFTDRIDNIKASWCLYLIIKKATDGNEHISLLIRCLNQKNFKVSINTSFLLASSIYSLEADYTFDSLGFNDLLSIPKERLKNQGNVECTIACNITAFNQDYRLLSNSEYFSPFTKLINSKQFSDVILCVEGKQLYAYKGILSSRSPVFMAMFSHNMIELKAQRVEIEDVSYNTMYDLLRYMYTNLVPRFQYGKTQNKCKSLLIAADKYGLEILKFKLGENLSSNIQVCNVFDFLNFADSYNVPRLKTKAIEFISSHNDEIANSATYKEFGTLHPDLSCEVFRSVLTKKRKLA